MGAISSQFTQKALFWKCKTTNATNVIKFMHKLRGHFTAARGQVINVVLDNHRAHIGPEVRQTIERLRIKFLFLPVCTPELNSIECLWSVIKRDFKRRLAELKFEKLDQNQFSAILTKSLNAITAEQQSKAANTNNRDFLRRIWREELGGSVPMTTPKQRDVKIITIRLDDEEEKVEQD